MKKIIVIVLIFLNLIILIVNISFFKSENKVNNEDQKIVYDNFSIKISQPELILNDEFEGLIYFGRDTCPNCLIINEFLQNEFNKNSNLLIYKFDTDIWREYENYNMILNKFEITNIPTLVKVSKGQRFEKFELYEEKNNKSKLQDMIAEFIY